MSGETVAGLWGWIAMVGVLTVVWTAAVLVIAWQLRPGTDRSRGAGRACRDDALAVAQRAYVRGELTHDRYLEVVADLHGAVPRPHTSG